MNKPKKIADCHSNIQYKISNLKSPRPAHTPIQSVIPTGVLRSLDEAGRSGGIYSKSSAQRFLNFALYVLHFASPKAALAKALLPMAVMIIPLSSCTLYRPVAGETGHYYINPYADFSTVGKTVVFELDNLSTHPELSTDLTQAITEAVQKRHLFSLSALYRAESAWRKLDLNGSSSYSLEELSVIRQQSKADAVLFGRINQYHPYPHLLVALHLKLIDLRNGKLLWATEQVWDSTDKSVERRMRLYFNTRMRAGFQPLDWELLITSPRAFNKFIACEVAQTLPRANRYTKRLPTSENVRNFKDSNKTSRVIPSVAHVIPSVAHVIPSVAHVIPSVARVIPSVARVIPSVARVIPSVAEESIVKVILSEAKNLNSIYNLKYQIYSCNVPRSGSSRLGRLSLALLGKNPTISKKNFQIPQKTLKFSPELAKIGASVTL
jgi:hypothetical protein